MTKIILAEDHQVIRQKLKRLLAQEPEWQVAAEAADGLEAVRLAREMKPDVLVTDLALPGLHGLEVVRRVHQSSSLTRIVVVSIHADEPYVRQALRRGAWGYVRKDELGQHLLPAIHSALAGKRYLSPSLSELTSWPAPRQRSRPAPGTFEALDLRERSGLQLMAEGYTDSEIALFLRMTPVRAEKLRFRLMRQLGLRTQTELAALARQCGLVGGHRVP